MKTNWLVKKLGEVAEFQSGFAIAKTKSTPKGIPHLRTFNVDTSGKLNLSEFIYIPENLISKNGFGLKKGDILFNNTNSKELVGKSSIVEEDLPYAFSNHLTRLRISYKEIIPEWILLTLINLWQKGYFLYNSVKWIGQAGFSAEKLKNLEIPVPPIEKQKRIVKKLEKILSKIQEARALRQESIIEIEQMLKSAIFNHFSKTTAKKEEFREVAVLERGKFTPRPRNDPKYFGGSTPWIQIGDITDKEGKYINSYSGTLNEEGLAVSKMFSAGTVVTSIAASIGTTGILGFDSAFPDSLIGIQGKEVLNDYVYYYLLFMHSHLNFIAPQVAQKNINLKILGDLEIPVPDLKEQEKIVAYLDSLNGKVQILQKLQQEQLQELEALKQSVLHQAFQGKL